MQTKRIGSVLTKKMCKNPFTLYNDNNMSQRQVTVTQTLWKFITLNIERVNDSESLNLE